MPFEQPPSPLAPTGRKPRPWAVPLSGGAATGMLLLTALSNPAYVDEAVSAAAVAAAVTVLLTWQGWRFARRVEAQLAAAAPRPAAQPDSGPRFHDVLEAAPDPLLVISGGEPDDIVGRRVVFANTAARGLFRIQRDGALLVTVVRDPEVLEAVDEALFGGVGRTAAYETGGAQDRFWRAWTRPLPGGADGQKLALLVLRDETDSRRMEQMRADFLANASHELRTPLASLAGFIETLRGHAKDDPAARERFLDIMADQADRMRRLIADLLSLSRIELNEHIPPTGAVDLPMMTMDVIDALGPLARQKGVVLRLRSPEGGGPVATGERDQIVQVVQNLIDNAIKYSPSGGEVQVEIETEGDPERPVGADPTLARLSLLTPDRADDARYAVIRVRDAGPGMERQHLPRLTERFYRVEGQKSGGERPGTGLGLAIVKHIVNRHRGGLVVESAPGRGSTFTVFLPRTRSSAAKPRSGAEEGAAVDPLRNKTVIGVS